MRDSLRLGRVAGFPVAVNWSVFVIVLLLAWGLADGVLPIDAPGHATATYWLAGVVGALLLLCSLLAHELAHALVARREGVEVERLTLWLFGGVATLRGEAPTPGADLRIAAVGPATSLVLAAVFGMATWAAHAGGAGDLVVSVVAWLAYVNLLLGLFNLLPGAPLDGGRVLRAVLWRIGGDRRRAADRATDAGVAEHVLKGVTVGDVMGSDVRTGDADLSVDAFVEHHVLRGRHSAHPVLAADGTVLGLVTLDQLRAVPPANRVSTTVGEICLPLREIATCAPTTALRDVLPRLTRESGNRALVLEDGRLVGILTPADVARTLEARTLLEQDEAVRVGR